MAGVGSVAAPYRPGRNPSFGSCVSNSEEWTLRSNHPMPARPRRRPLNPKRRPNQRRAAQRAEPLAKRRSPGTQLRTSRRSRPKPNRLNGKQPPATMWLQRSLSGKSRRTGKAGRVAVIPIGMLRRMMSLRRASPESLVKVRGNKAMVRGATAVPGVAATDPVGRGRSPRSPPGFTGRLSQEGQERQERPGAAAPG